MEDKISEEIVKQYEDRRSDYVSFCQEIEHIITQLLQIKNINYHSLTCRTKTIESLTNKLRKKGGKYKSLSDITDLAGIRIITYYSDVVDNIAEIIEQEFKIDKKNTIDKRVIMDPDKFGYISLHYIIQLNDIRSKLPENMRFNELKAEIQLRTILQHAWADIEHDLGYKTKKTIPRNIQRDFSRLSGLLELADKEFLNIRNSLSEYRDYVSKNINKPDEKILLDKVSLTEFINTNQPLQQLNKQIADICSGKLNRYGSIDDDVNRLQLLGIKTINKLNDVVFEDRDLAYYIAQEILGGESKFTPDKAIGLFYLFYAHISKIKEKNKIYEILDDSKISFDNNNDRRDFANKLSGLYSSFLQNQTA